MQAKVIELTVAVLFASVASGQSVDRVFRFRDTQTVQGYQEMATVLRTVAGIRELSVDTAKASLTVHGAADQIELAEWLFSELDQPAGGRKGTPQNGDAHEYRIPGGRDDLVRVFHLKHVEAPRGLQELVTSIRKSAGIQRIFPCDGPRTVALRGTSNQIAIAERLINEADESK